jgi:hypothetical protein
VMPRTEVGVFMLERVFWSSQEWCNLEGGSCLFHVNDLAEDE